MMRSLWSAVSGLRNHQVRMDVIGNNIANVNTVAFKGSRVTFKEAFAQTLQGATRPVGGDQGGINAMQVGVGMQIASVDALFSQGNFETTGLNTDLAIQGPSFFVVARGNEHLFTRAGNFQLDADGRLTSPPNGFVVQGRGALDGVLDEAVGDIKIPLGQKTAAKPTSAMTLGGNLDASAPIFTGTFDAAGRANRANADAWTQSEVTVYDTLGREQVVKMYFWKTGDSEWSYQLDDATLPAGYAPAGIQTLTFDSKGQLPAGTAGPTISFTPDGADQLDITLDLGSGVNGITSTAGPSTAVLRDQNGYAAGILQSFEIDRTGLILGNFTNGTNVVLGQVVMADFNNPTGLLHIGDNMFAESANSGRPVFGIAGEGSPSSILAGALEMSNVDLAQEFTNMIVAQRGFQANGRVITTVDQMLDEVVNLKR